jgi:hypothetical protein
LLNDTKETAVFELKSRGEPESLDWSSFMVIWSHTQRRVHAVQFTDPARIYTTVYVVTDYVIDPALELDEVMNPTYPNYYVKEHRPPLGP